MGSFGAQVASAASWHDLVPPRHLLARGPLINPKARAVHPYLCVNCVNLSNTFPSNSLIDIRSLILKTDTAHSL